MRIVVRPNKQENARQALRQAAEAARADEAALDAADSIAKLRLAVAALEARVKWLEEQMGEDGT